MSHKSNDGKDGNPSVHARAKTHEIDDDSISVNSHKYTHSIVINSMILQF